MRTILALTAAAAAAATVLIAPSPALAAPSCTAHAAMPARVALHGKQVVLRTVLAGSAGCHQKTDNGASADLHAPGTETENLRWRTFGSTQSVTLLSAFATTGTYRVTSGEVQVYDSAYRQVSWSWRPTTTTVKWAARADQVAAKSGHVTGRTVRSSKYGLVASRTKVYVQRRAAGTAAWHTLGSVRPDVHGYVSYATATSSSFAYRLVFHATPSVWGATSAAVRG